MPIRIIIYGKEGDGAAYSAMAQIRSLIREMRVDASVQMIADERQLKASGIEDTPTVAIDGLNISTGWVPSRGEVQRAIQMRVDQVTVNKPPTGVF